MKVLWIPIIELLIGLPIVIAIRAAREKDDKIATEKENERRLEEEERAEMDVVFRKILTKTMKALQKAGAGSGYIVAALRQEEIDGKIAEAALNLQIEHTEKWKDTSTRSAHEHYRQIDAILRNAGIELKGAGA